MPGKTLYSILTQYYMYGFSYTLDKLESGLGIALLNTVSPVLGFSS